MEIIRRCSRLITDAGVDLVCFANSKHVLSVLSGRF